MQKTILIVDDRVINREFLAMLLGYAGYRVLEAVNGAQALDMARLEQPALVISDVLMPVMDGIELANRLHADPAIARIPMIFYTATYRVNEARRLAQTCGVTVVLAKPSKPQLILDTVARALGTDSTRAAKNAFPDIKTAPILPEPAALLRLQKVITQLRLQKGITVQADAGATPDPRDAPAYAPDNVQILSLRLAAALELSVTLASERDPLRLLDLFCRAAQDIMSARRAAVGMRGNGRPKCFACSGMTAIEVEAIFEALDQRAGIVQERFAGGLAFGAREARDDPALRELPPQHPLRRRFLMVPVMQGLQAHGWLYLADRLGADFFGEIDQEFAATLAAQLAPLYENLSLYGEVQQHAGQLEIEVVERKRAAELLLESETKFRQLAENLHEVFFLLNRESGAVLYVSPGYEGIWGRSCASLYAEPNSWMESIHPDDLPAVIEGNKARDSTGRYDYQYRLLRSPTDMRWIRASVFPIVNDAGEVFRVAGIAEDISPQMRLQQALGEREAGLRRAQQMNKSAHVITGKDGAFESWSETLPQLIGMDEALIPLTTRNWLDIVHPSDRGRFRDCCIEAGKRGLRAEIECRVRRGDGAYIELHQVLEPLEGQADAQGNMRWFNTIQDVTEQKEQQRKIARLSRISAVLSGINSAIVRIRDRKELFQEACRIAVNQGAFGMAWVGEIDPQTLEGAVVAWCGGQEGYLDKVQLTARAGLPHSERPACVAVREKRPVICNDISTEPTLLPLRDALLAGGHRSMAAFPLPLDKRATAVIALFADEPGIFDEEEIKLLNELAGDLSFGLQFIDKEEKLNYLAYYDVLTGLANSMLFHDRLAQFLIGAKHQSGIVAVIVLDIDHFAQLNDALGRHAGDAVLRQVAERLGACLTEPYSLARIGGDTFAIAIPDLQQAAELAAILEQRIFAAFSRDFVLDQQETRVTARAGLALYPEDGRHAETLLKHAEVALKKAKSSGERFLYYAPQMNAAIAARLALEKELRVALDMRQFEVHYQPRVDLLSGRIVSAEALIRWRHPQRGLVPPLQFIPLAEETGLIEPIGAWIIDAVCAQQAAWQARQVEIVPVAVNLSTVQFKNGAVLDTIRNAILMHQLEQKYIEFELTESVVMNDPEEAARHLQALKKMGAKLALDDFGTGYSSLAYLKRFPFDFVKIDRAFVTDITNNPGDAVIAAAVIAMAHSLGLRVVAEGVETEGQLRYLRKHRCDEMQGYYFSPPVPAAAFESMLAEDKRLALALEPAEREDSLLIVDDEPNNLSALKRLLRQEGYRVLTAINAQEGLELLALNSVQVILADQRIPGMSGAQFLSVAKELYPDTIRIILTAYTDLEAVTDSVNRGAVFKFLTKPWDDDLLREHIRDAFRRYRPAPLLDGRMDKE